ncbi:hypothetical protein HHI36_020563 [Cryptolaemus montrouzieri]|uniref:Uncharacterized protein n=1 Tax=Cryptolaemus montrouzieri TaxID=559131 RepID=A0ABD2NBA4_9CUCU
MSNSDEEDLTMAEVEEALNKIEMKYSKYISNDNTNKINKNLLMLLQEFDALGLPEIDPSLPSTEIYKEVVRNSHVLVEMYRRNLNQLDEDELSFKTKDTKYVDLQKKLSHINDSYNMKEMLNSQRNEMQKIKLYYSSKQNELQHSVRKLEKNNQDLKDMFGQDVGKYLAKDDVIANYVKKCKLNEEIYKTTIKQLQEKNENLLAELIRLKEK